MAEKRMTRKEFDEQVKELTKLIQEKTIAFADDTPDRKLERVERSRDDLAYFAETYFPHYVTAEFSKWHVDELQKIETALDSTMTSIVAEAWFRGSGKSTLLAVILPIWAAITKRSYFTIYSGADRELTKERTIATKLELVYNGRLRYDYPDIAMRLDSGEEHDFETPTGCRALALGYKMAIKGKSHGRHRPRLIIIDDLESHLDTNPRIAEKKYQYITEEAFGCFGPKGGLLLWLGNLTNSSSALNKFIERCNNDPNPYMRYRVVKAIDEDGKSNWPEAYSLENLQAKRAVMGAPGFDRHYMMKPGIDGDIFKDDWLRFYNIHNPKPIDNMPGFGFRFPGREDLLAAPMITFTDPSLGNGETNDYKATVTVAFWNGFYWIMDVKIQKCTIIEMLEYMYDVNERFPGTRQYMEDIFWQKLIREWLPQVAVRKGFVLPIAGHSPRLKKEERILAIQPLFEFSNIYTCVQGVDWNLMKEQLIGFPNAGYDDGPDALAAAIEMFKHVASRAGYQTMEANNYTPMY